MVSTTRGQFDCHPGQHFPGVSLSASSGVVGGGGGVTQNTVYEPQPHVTVSYAAYPAPGAGVAAGVVPLLPGQNPHHPAWSLHRNPAATPAKQHHSWMANYHGFVQSVR